MPFPHALYHTAQQQKGVEMWLLTVVGETRAKVDPGYDAERRAQHERNERGYRAAREERPLNEDPAVHLGIEYPRPHDGVCCCQEEMDSHEPPALAQNGVVSLDEAE